MGEDSYGFTLLEYEIQQAVLPVGRRRVDELSKVGGLTWSTSESRKFEGLQAINTDLIEFDGQSDLFLDRPGNNAASYNNPATEIPHKFALLVDRLIANTTYLFRVRARTVVGWSTWSEVSDEVMTLSVP